MIQGVQSFPSRNRSLVWSQKPLVGQPHIDVELSRRRDGSSVIRDHKERVVLIDSRQGFSQRVVHLPIEPVDQITPTRREIGIVCGRPGIDKLHEEVVDGIGYAMHDHKEVVLAADHFRNQGRHTSHLVLKTGCLLLDR